MVVLAEAYTPVEASPEPFRTASAGVKTRPAELPDILANDWDEPGGMAVLVVVEPLKVMSSEKVPYTKITFPAG